VEEGGKNESEGGKKSRKGVEMSRKMEKEKGGK